MDTNNDADIFRPGQLIGDYEIVCPIGCGAMSQVYLAVQLSLQRQVALKILRWELSLDETNVRRFIQEAQAAAKLDHPNIVRIYEIGVFDQDALRKKSHAGRSLFRSGSDRFFRLFQRRRFGTVSSSASSKERPGSSVFSGENLSKELPKNSPARRKSKKHWNRPIHFISQEYVAGLNLQIYLRRQGVLSLRQTFLILLQICYALERAAQFGIVHRDIKPENILLNEQGEVKVADFGLAYCSPLSNMASMSLTQAGLTLGTPLYMSPEQAEGRPIDFRSDLYSLGITAFQILTGKTPFHGDTPLAVVLQHVNQPAPSVRSLRPDVSPELDKILSKMMAKQPQDRYSSFHELIVALKTAQRHVTGGPVFSSESDESGDARPSTALELCLEPSSRLEGDNLLESDEDNGFHRSLVLTSLTSQLQTSLSRLAAFEEKKNRPRRFFQKKRFWGIGVLFLAFCLAMFYHSGRIGIVLEHSFPNSIERFDTVEEQWVFAAQLGTEEGWKSVITYFPSEEYWNRRAQQQLARLYMLEDNQRKARPLFQKFANMPAANNQYVAFGLAGLAWCFVQEGDFQRASAILSSIKTDNDRTLDGITEDLIARTQELIRQR